MSLMPLLFAADHLLCSPHTTTLVKTSHEALPTVQETHDGWLIKASLPGLGAGDVSVEITKAKDGNDTTENHLLLHALPRFKTELRLPRNADMQRVSASLIAGVLTVAVPKVHPETVPVTVEAVALPDDLPEPRGQVSLALPGLGAGDVTVSITRDRSLLLHVKGSNRVCGSVHEVLKLPDRAVAAEARASMVNGIFSFSVPIAAEVVSALTVAAEEEPAPMETADAEAGAHTDAKAVLLLEAAVPGLAASDFTAEARGRTLTISSTKAPATSKRQLRRSVLLPPHTRAPDDVHVSCVNGLLKVTATVHKPERLAITVSATEAAVLTSNAAAAGAAPVDAAPAIEAMQADGAEAEAAAGAQ